MIIIFHFIIFSPPQADFFPVPNLLYLPLISDSRYLSQLTLFLNHALNVVVLLFLLIIYLSANLNLFYITHIPPLDFAMCLLTH